MLARHILHRKDRSFESLLTHCDLCYQIPMEAFNFKYWSLWIAENQLLFDDR